MMDISFFSYSIQGSHCIIPFTDPAHLTLLTVQEKQNQTTKTTPETQVASLRGAKSQFTNSKYKVLKLLGVNL